MNPKDVKIDDSSNNKGKIINNIPETLIQIFFSYYSVRRHTKNIIFTSWDEAEAFFLDYNAPNGFTVDKCRKKLLKQEYKTELSVMQA
ncbi:31894_t:CDS:2 [Racocetra persica]|uniref:31894_t:CDS:1 n=1 Tax=Racocetra persica TaxID=160502 RepID=A0ACA9RCZ8_9GLOM|nr:31894_t:CDS:2 [Racocetra persica]